MLLFYTNKIQNDTALFSDEEMRHIQNSLRKSSGDTLHFTDGNGTIYTGEILSTSKKQLEVSIIDRKKHQDITPYLHIAVAPTKNMDRIEWFVEKATEQGINEISFVQCKHSERKNIKMDRLQRIAIAAMKQSLKAYLPKINDLVSFDNWASAQKGGQKMIACLTENNLFFSKGFSTNTPTTICIGPEGGFREDEINSAINKGFRPVSLGNQRLRTETAALTSVSYVRLLNEME